MKSEPPVIVKLDLDGLGTAYREALDGCQTQDHGSTVVITTAAEGTREKQPSVLVGGYIGGRRVAFVFTARQLTNAFLAMAGCHQSIHDHLEASGTVAPMVSGVPIGGIINGVAWDGFPFNGYIIRVEGQVECGLATDASSARTVAEQLIGF